MSLDDVYKKLLSSQKTSMAVVDDGQVKGIISLDGVGRYFMIKAALRKNNA